MATLSDEAAIRRLLRENPMGGAIQITFEREPDYFRGADLSAGSDQTILVYAGSQLACVGRCTRRSCWVDGESRSVGYLGELRLDASVRGHVGVLRDGYRFFQETQREAPADLYFTSIASDNLRARRLLESGVRGLPRYDFLGELTTVLVAVPRHAKAPPFQIVEATPDRLPSLVEFLNLHGRRRQLAAVWTEEGLRSLARQGLPLERFRLVLRGDEIVACGALWDQRGFRQTVIRGYARSLAFARPLINFASRFLSTSWLPRPGSPVAQAFLSPLALAEGCEKMLPGLLAAFFPLAAELGLEFLTLGLPSGDERLRALQRSWSTRVWPSRLYRVEWPGLLSAPIRQRETAFLPEVALL